MIKTPGSISFHWLRVALLSCLVVNIVIIAGLVINGDRFEEAFSTTVIAEGAKLLEQTDDDSWKAMALAQQYFDRHPDGDLYGVYFKDKVKFQYPPSALLFLKLFPRSLYDGVDSVRHGTDFRRMLSTISAVALLLTMVLSAAIFSISANRFVATERAGKVMMTPLLVVTACLLGMSYFPLVTGHNLGQIQVFLGLFIAAAILFYLLDLRVLSGVCIGICCLVKPQYAMVFLWGLIRRDGRFLLALAAVGAVGLAVSMATFGWQNHLRYLEVLRDISWHGESYWPNQSVNGFLHRFLGNGSADVFLADAFAPHHPVVYYATLLSSLLIAGLALWPRARGMSGGWVDILDLCIVLMAATLASPVAWTHHYGTYFPVFAAVLPILMMARPLGRLTAPLLVLSYLSMANVLLRNNAIFDNAWLGTLRSHLFGGALLLFALSVLSLRQGRHRDAVG